MTQNEPKIKGVLPRRLHKRFPEASLLLSAKPVAVMIGTATMTSPQALHTYFMRNCSTMMYQRRLDRIRCICSARAR